PLRSINTGRRAVNFSSAIACWNFAFPALTLASNAAASNRLPGTANSAINASSKFRRLSICASLPVLLNVAVPQLVMAIAVTQKNALRIMKFFAVFGFIGRGSLGVDLAPTRFRVSRHEGPRAL